MTTVRAEAVSSMLMSYGPGELLHGGTGGHISSLKSQFMETEAWHSFVSESQVISSV